MAQFARLTAIGWRNGDDATAQSRVGGSGWYQFGSSTADTTPPTLIGILTEVSKTQTTISISWPAGSDNVAVISYEVSSNGGSLWTDVGNVLSHSFSGLTANTAYPIRVRAKDGAGLTSTPPLELSVTTLPVDASAPVMTGSITVGLKTNGTIAYSFPAGTDDVGIVAYDVRVDGGAWNSIGTATSDILMGLTSSTPYVIEVSARDGAGLRSNILSVTTSTYPDGASGQYIIDATGPIDGNPAGILYNKVVLPEDEDKWFSFIMVAPPSTGTLDINPDGTFTFVGPAPDLAQFQLYVNNVAVGSPWTVTFYDGMVYKVLKYWNGSTWVTKPLKYWNGSAWVTKPLKYWNGTTWS